jgi:hypothetical protein
MTSNQETVIIKATEFNSSKDVYYRKPRVNKSGGKAIGIGNSRDKSHLLLNTPSMLTWGVNTRVDDKTGRISYDMSLQFPTEEYANPETIAFQESMIAMEKQVCSDAIKNSKEWFGKAKLTKDQVEVLFNPMLYWPKDKATGEVKQGAAPSLRVKIDKYDDDDFKCEVFDLEGNPLYPNPQDDTADPTQLIPDRSQVACIIKCGGVYFVNGKFGITWRLDQIVVKPKYQRNRGKCLINMSSADKSKMSSQSIEEDEEAEVQLAADDSEEEDEVEAADEVADEVADDVEVATDDIDEAEAEAVKEVKQEVEKISKKVVKKKVVRKKKVAE